MRTDITKETPRSSDEIDLIELGKNLWDKKGWILLSTFIFTALAGIYAFTAKEQWTSKAEITNPTTIDAGSYLSLRNEYNRILEIESSDSQVFLENLFNKFKQFSFSLNKREDFLATTDVYSQLTKGLDDVGQRRMLSKLARENINVIIPDLKKEPNAIGIKFSFSAEKPDIAQKTLTQFIEFTNQQAFGLDYNEFLVQVTEKINGLKFESEKIKTDLSIEQGIQLENLNKALIIAEKAGIKEYSKDSLPPENVRNVQSITIDGNKNNKENMPLYSNSQLKNADYLFMLGEKYLKAQIDVTHEKDVIYPPRYYQITEKINKLENVLEKAKTIEANTFSYVSEADYPVVKDKPNMILILGSAAILGAVLAILSILFRFRLIFNKNE